MNTNSHDIAAPVIEFVGGPYDGFQHVLTDHIPYLTADIILPVSLNLILAATGCEHGPLLPFRHVAAYRLGRKGAVWQYLFLGEAVVDEVNDVGL